MEIIAASISVATLSRYGLLKDGANSLEGFHSHGIWFVVYRLEEGLVRFIHKASRGEFYAQDVDVCEIRAGRRLKWQFACPLTGAYCNSIMLYGTLWGSRRGHGLTPLHSSDWSKRYQRLIKQKDDLIAAVERPGVHSSTREKRFKEVRRALGKTDFLVPDDWRGLDGALGAVRVEFAQRAKRELRREHRGRRDLKTAIEGGFSAEGSVELGMHLHIGSRNTLASAVEESRTQRRTRTLADQGRHICLDLALLRSRGWMDENNYVAWLLDWPNSHPDGDRCLLVLDLRGEKKWLYLDFFDNGGQRVASQTLSIEAKPKMKNRLFLKCPVNGTLHDRLYFRDGFFASASAQRLTTPSQLPVYLL